MTWYIENFDALVDRINKGEAIEIVSGRDDICAALRPGGKTACAHAKECRKASVVLRDRWALKDAARVLRRPVLQAGDTLALRKADIRRLRLFFARGAIRGACTACQWHALCSRIAAENFHKGKLAV